MKEELARRAAHALLARMSEGRVELNEEFSGRRFRFGPRRAERESEMTIRSPAVYARLLRDRSVGMAETYAQGMWDSRDLVTLLRIGAREVNRADPIRRRLAPFVRPVQRVSRLPLLNTRRGARRNIAAHYDLGNDMFEAFLDGEAMLYSSALYEHEGATLEEAQAAKLERICARLELAPDDHLLEIGTGWGGMAIWAASRHGCRVTTTTISREQREYAEARVRAAGLEDRITVLGADYRDLTGTYDKLVSIEMIEAVGWEYFDTYFKRCSELLGPRGLFLCQAIVVDDRGFEAEKASRSFAMELIFPGGCLPSREAIARSVSRHTDMRTVWLDDISSSYALTLAEWRRRFLAATPKLAELGYDERFRRMWEIWLAASEAGFREGRISDLQILMAKPEWRGQVDMARKRDGAAQEEQTGRPAT
ncbi:MAG TPA: cyclopropane-fatty-acyl-phospholipid synthase family protein [Solirubrobacterales bacterium]